MLTANNNSLNAKIEELIQKSGDHSDLLSKLNEELGTKQNEFDRRERQMEAEIETLLRDKESKENEIRSLRVRMFVVVVVVVVYSADESHTMATWHFSRWTLKTKSQSSADLSRKSATLKSWCRRMKMS